MGLKRIELPVSAALRPWVSSIGLTSAAGPPDTVVHPPDTAAALVYCTTTGGERGLLVMGPRTRASYFAADEAGCSIKVRLRPGRARPLLGVPVSEMIDRALPLGELWGEPGDRLAAELARIGDDVPALARRIERALLDHLASRPAGELYRSDLTYDAVRSLSARAHLEPVGAIARRLAISERQFRTVFTDGVGMSPKRFVRIDRVRTVLAGVRGERWSQLAVRAGYYDQSHMTAEFRKIMGVPPGAYAAGRLPAPAPADRRSLTRGDRTGESRGMSPSAAFPPPKNRSSRQISTISTNSQFDLK